MSSTEMTEELRQLMLHIDNASTPEGGMDGWGLIYTSRLKVEKLLDGFETALAEERSQNLQALADSNLALMEAQELAQAANQQAEEARTRADNAEGMAESMEMFRSDMIRMGVITEKVPPMFMTEAISNAMGERLAAQKAELAAAPQQHAQAGQPFNQVEFDKMVEKGTAAWAGVDFSRDAAPAQPIAGELPPLPECWSAGSYLQDFAVFTADQMEAYGHQCRAAALEEAAKACDRGVEHMVTKQQRDGAARCAATIRALNKTEGV